MDGEKLKAAANEADKATINMIQGDAKKVALKNVALLPIFMLLCYIGLLLYFRSKGGYRPVLIGEH